jgi:hypothetical protein
VIAVTLAMTFTVAGDAADVEAGIVIGGDATSAANDIDFVVGMEATTTGGIATSLHTDCRSTGANDGAVKVPPGTVAGGESGTEVVLLRMRQVIAGEAVGTSLKTGVLGPWALGAGCTAVRAGLVGATLTTLLAEPEMTNDDGSTVSFDATTTAAVVCAESTTTGAGTVSCGAGTAEEGMFKSMGCSSSKEVTTGVGTDGNWN